MDWFEIEISMEVDLRIINLENSSSLIRRNGNGTGSVVEKKWIRTFYLSCVVCFWKLVVLMNY